MATGLPYRQPGRENFASQPVDPAQTTTGATADSRGAQAVGGKSIGGARGGAYSGTSNAATALGGMLNSLLAPQIEQKKREKFFEGFVAAQNGQTLQELTDSDSPLTRIFGPSSFAEGAEYYTGRQAIAEWTSSQMAEMDTLKQLSPDDFAKHLSGSIEQFTGQSPAVDAAIMEAYLENQAGLTQQYSKARYAWQQGQAIEAYNGAYRAGSENFQNIMSSVGADSPEGQEALAVHAQSLEKPPGMADETYKSTVFDNLMLNLAKGEFYAVEAARAAGVEALFSPEQQKSMQDAYVRYSRIATQNASNHPEVLAMRLQLEAQIKSGELGGEGMSAVDVVAAMQAINARVQKLTGSSIPLFDGDDLAAGGKAAIGINSKIFRQQQADIQAMQDKQAKEDEKLRMASYAVTPAGSVESYRQQGGDMSLLDGVLLAQMNDGNYSSLARVYINEGHVAANAKRRIAAMTQAGLGEEYTEATNTAFKMWEAMHQENPALSMAYFGEFDARFQRFDDLLGQQVGEDHAYRQAFGRGGSGLGTLPAEERAEFDEAVSDGLSKRVDGWGQRGQMSKLSDRGTRALKNYLEDAVSKLRAFGSTASVAQDTENVIMSAFSRGAVEGYGKYVWVNGKRTEKLHVTLGSEIGETREILEEAVKRKLTELGLDDYQDLELLRIPGRGFAVLVHNETGEGANNFNLPLRELREIRDEWVERSKQDFNIGTPGNDPLAQRGLGGL